MFSNIKFIKFLFAICLANISHSGRNYSLLVREITYCLLTQSGQTGSLAFLQSMSSFRPALSI